MRMTAAVMYEQGLRAPFAQSRPFHIQEVELDNPGYDELLVEVRGAGLCHSDLTTLEGQQQAVVLGAAAIVVQVEEADEPAFGRVLEV